MDKPQQPLDQGGYIRRVMQPDKSEPAIATAWCLSGFHWGLVLALVTISMVACQQQAPAVPTMVVAAPSLTATIPQQTMLTTQTVPPTFTPRASEVVDPVTPAILPSFTPLPSHTPWSTFTPTGTATNTPGPTATQTETPVPTIPAPIALGTNLLPNPSFEEGWYHINGIPELQVPNGWTLEWHDGKNQLDPDPWNRYVRPESRVLNGDFLPEDEHALFIWDGAYTTKIFKRQGALSFRLTTQVRLYPGTYLFEINVFPDMIESYSEMGGKIWASDPLSAELRFYVDNPGGDWTLPTFGQRNTFHHAFQVFETRVVRLGVEFRGRWAIENNGWFMDDWSLTQLSPS